MDNHLSKHSILIGDLISAHFYTLLAEINDLSFQNEISKAIVEINELKSSLHHQALNDYEISQAIEKLKIIFPYITLSHFGINIDESEIYNYLFEDMSDYYPSYFKKYNQRKGKDYLHYIQKSYLKRSRQLSMADNKANKEQVHRVFQNISKKYDRLNNIISFEQHKVWTNVL